MPTAGEQGDPLIMGLVSQWPADVRELFEERAAIMEFDGGLRRVEAERAAFRRLHQKATQ